MPWKTQITFKQVVVALLFSLGFFPPCVFTIYILIESGFQNDMAVLLVALCMPAILIPTLPKSYRKDILRAGWPARLAFALPALVIGLTTITIAVFELGHWPYLSIVTLGLFSMIVLMGGLFLLLPDSYE